MQQVRDVQRGDVADVAAREASRARLRHRGRQGTHTTRRALHHTICHVIIPKKIMCVSANRIITSLTRRLCFDQ
eukprot:30942-Pelagococcus_subviridis.AAC.13